ncbi:hypothetical protein FRC07_000732 [Ceratobasidium sp. 392]|nr:hypothetical protein FRC07_000732 [Ceratobasidium sp. 392]
MATPSTNLTAIVKAVVADATTTAVAPSATPTEAAVVQRHGQNDVGVGGLNLTKLDHVRQNALPKASRQQKDYLRPLWLIGMILYILSQLLGSTLALEYMRAEYVAPLGSTSLIFNFMFASILVGTPVGRNDIYGTIVVVLGVCGIVAFGSINSGLETETDIAHLSALWGRSGWLLFFILMSTAITVVFFCTSILDSVLAARSDLSALPASAMLGRQPVPNGTIAKARMTCITWEASLRDLLERWTASRDDKLLAWTLGIGWACVGGSLAGGCLVFAKASVKLISGKLSHENEGNQIGHPAAIITFIFLAITAVSQIIALNKGLKKPDPVPANATALGTPSRVRTKASDEEAGDERDLEALHGSAPGEREEVVWQIGDADESDDEGGAGRAETGTSQIRPDLNRRRSGSGSLRARANSYVAPKHQGEEGRGLMGAHDEEDEQDETDHRHSPAQSLRRRDDDSDEEFGVWKQATPTSSPRARR